ncbi:hypothetical protein [Reyranella sp.]|uniref:hypothetical protein n=1 Tax=Reyranella sp. TaxID=1929291 RepID=UPI003C7C22B8
MGFSELNRLFNGEYASTRAEEAFDAGEHFLLKPLTTTIFPLVAANAADDSRTIVDILRRQSPAFSVDGVNAEKSLKSMVETALSLVKQLSGLWKSGTIGEVLRFSIAKQLIAAEKAEEHLARGPRAEKFDEAVHSLDKGDWLADALFAMPTVEIERYASFISNNTAFSTQHGVKGEEYAKVVVVYDDVEAGWNLYNFSKMFTPATSGEPTDGQRDRGRRLAYVSFSRALEDLRVLLFTTNPTAARQELIDRKLVEPEQIDIVVPD